MKLLRYGPEGEERPGLLDDEDAIRDLSGVVSDIAGDVLTDAGLARVRAVDPASLPLVPGDPRIGPCVGNIGKFVCIGLNYVDHAIESNLPVPAEPIVFNKWTSAVCGPHDRIEIPRGSKKTDWEVELGVVIGKACKYVDEAHALAHVAGYCVVNDLSEREWQLERGGTWDKGKGCDTFGPIGPWLRQHAHHGVQCCAAGFIPIAGHEPAAGRRDLDRHAAGRRHGREAVPGISEAGPDDPARHRGFGRTAANHIRGRLTR